MELTKIKIKDIKGAKYNPRIMSSEEMKKLENSINEFGVVDPIVINLNNNTIIGGHQRFQALQNLNKKEKEWNMLKLGDVGWIFPDTELKIESDSVEKALNIALNKISGDWDTDKLSELFEELDYADIDLDLTGFDNSEIEELKIIKDIEFYDPDDIDLESIYEDPAEEKKKKEKIICPYCGEEIEC